MPHLYYPNELLDFLRLLLFFVGAYSLTILLVRYRNGGKDWNVKTKDHWFGLVMWSLAGCVFSLQGVALDRPLTVGFVFLTAAVLATGKAVHKNGDWGSNAE